MHGGNPVHWTEPVSLPTIRASRKPEYYVRRTNETGRTNGAVTPAHFRAPCIFTGPIFTGHLPGATLLNLRKLRHRVNNLCLIDCTFKISKFIILFFCSNFNCDLLFRWSVVNRSPIDFVRIFFLLYLFIY